MTAQDKMKTLLQFDLCVLIGDITEKGFRIEQMTLWLKYQEYLRYPPKNDTSFTKPVVRKLLSFVEVPILQMNQEDKVPVYRQNDYSYKTLEDLLKSGRQYTDEGHFPWEEKNVFGKFEKVGF